jgi:hypothetical protein
MLGQPISMLIPEVVGFRLTGHLKEGLTATDLVLRVVELLRKKGVVGKFVEFYGEGLDHLPLADRATIGNMAPEYGATCGFFPVDNETLRYMRVSGRDEDRIALAEAYAKENGFWRGADYNPVFTDTRASGTYLRAAHGCRVQAPPGQAGAGGRRGLFNVIRQGGDRVDHFLHQYLEPLCDDRRRAGGAQSACAGTDRSDLGQDLTGPRQPGRLGLSGGS